MLKKLINRLRQYHGFSILCGIGIFILCTIKIPPQDNLPEFPNFDKFVHLMMYFFLSIAVILETVNIKSESVKAIFKTFLTAIIVTAIFGGMIELIQSGMTDYRSGDMTDWFFDIGGSVLACLTIGLVRLASR